jgi:hypothetical protein
MATGASLKRDPFPLPFNSINACSHSTKPIFQNESRRLPVAPTRGAGVEPPHSRARGGRVQVEQRWFLQTKRWNTSHYSLLSGAGKISGSVSGMLVNG